VLGLRVGTLTHMLEEELGEHKQPKVHFTVVQPRSELQVRADFMGRDCN
jgi:hypothetical protein